MKINDTLKLLPVVMLAALVMAQAHAAGDQDWANIGLADLVKTEVESVSRKKQAISDTPAAVFVITADDIKRSGALSLPEILHLAPGVEVARLSNNKWAVTIRGFNGRMANKLLVLVDGRSIYSSLYGGVVWETEDMPLNEIERIEVVRGSAGLAWGSNGVNGVINIITKRAQDTEGWSADGHVGTSTGKAGGTLRYGAKFDDGSAFRVTLNDQKRDGGRDLNGNPVQDYWNDTSLGFRYDRPDGVSQRWFASGKIYDSNYGEPWLIPTFNAAALYDPARYGASRLVSSSQTSSGANLLGRLEQVTEGGGEVRLQAYVDQFKGSVPAITDERTTFDLEGHHRFPLGEEHDMVWGGNYRQNQHKETISPLGFLYAPQTNLTVTLASAFVQDEWAIVPRQFKVQAGVRVERQTYGGTTPEPAIRGMWNIDTQNSLWLSWAKMVRAPSVVERALGANYGIPAPGVPVLIRANPGDQSNFGNEKARTVELGYRGEWAEAFSADLVAFVSKYDGIFATLPNPVTTLSILDPACAAAMANYGFAGGAGMCQTFDRGNRYPVRTRGLELATEWRPLAYWRLQFNASRLFVDGMPLSTSGLIYGSSPKYQGSLRSSFDVGERERFDIWWRRIGGLAGSGNGLWPATATAPIAARTELDLRYAVQVDQSLEVSLAAQNLLSKQQLQFYPDYMPSLPVIPQRTVYLRAVWREK